LCVSVWDIGHVFKVTGCSNFEIWEHPKFQVQYTRMIKVEIL